MKRAIVSIKGGLGNQLFQFSFAKYLKQQHYEVILDTSFFSPLNKPSLPRPYELQRINEFPTLNLYRPLKQLMTCPIFGSRLFYPITDSPAPMGLTKARYIGEGYWQLPVYANFGRDAIRAALPKQEPTTPFIALCVRRGDYVNNPKVSKLYHTLDESYYSTALNILPKNLPIFAFTDDPEWVSNCLLKALGISERTTISQQPNNWAELGLLAKATHAIIANSTFHWWGAFLSNAEQVVSPTYWMKEQQTPHPLILPNWTRIENSRP